MTRATDTMDWHRPALGREASEADLGDKAVRTAVYRERGRDIHSSRHVDVAKTIARALEAAYQEGIEARTVPRSETGRRPKAITPLTLTPRPRTAMQSIATLTGGGVRAVILRRFDHPILPTKWVMHVQGMQGLDRDFGDTTLAQLRRLELLVPADGRRDALTLSHRGVAMARDGSVAVDHDASPAWTFA